MIYKYVEYKIYIKNIIKYNKIKYNKNICKIYKIKYIKNKMLYRYK